MGSDGGKYSKSKSISKKGKKIKKIEKNIK
jgi:hypothetical protein